MRRVLVTGSSGLLGAHVARQASGGYDVTALHHTHPVELAGCDNRPCDLTDDAEVASCLGAARPEVIIHCAALTDVELCERRPDLAERLNVEATATLVEWARRRNAQFVHLSTDAVFGGSAGAYREDQSPEPVNWYGRTKAKAEGVVSAAVPDAMIIRTNFYGWNVQPKLSLGEWIIDRLVQGERCPAFVDVFFNPLVADQLAEVVLSLIAQGASGIYHVAARDRCSKHKFAVRLAKTFGLSAAGIVPTCVDQSPLLARRPKRSTLAVDKVCRDLGRPMPSIQEGLERFKASQRAAASRVGVGDIR
ncbi:MAG: SDR family oxidoreductase [Candidatus Omnitrophica bacterium]|nr:SDR family oxidoreductase [Candidatus Omnitrophota bacterium]